MGDHSRMKGAAFGGFTFLRTREENCSGTGPIVGATVPMAVERRASVLGRSAR